LIEFSLNFLLDFPRPWLASDCFLGDLFLHVTDPCTQYVFLAPCRAGSKARDNIGVGGIHETLEVGERAIKFTQGVSGQSHRNEKFCAFNFATCKERRNQIVEPFF
jgi:hypothetical protein